MPTDSLEARLRRLEGLLGELVTELSRERAGALRAGAAPGGSDDPACARARAAGEEVAAIRAELGAVGQRLGELMDVVVALVSFDYARRAPVGDGDTVFDAMGIGLNTLAEELAASTVSKGYIDNIIQSMPDLLLVLDQDGVVKNANHAAGALLGCARDEIIGQRIERVLDGVSGPDLIQRESVGDQRMTCRTRRGAEVPISLSSAVMRDVHERLQGIVVVARDISESQRSEREQLALRDAMQRQAILLEELSTPVIPVHEGVIVVPLVGTLDKERAARMSELLLESITRAEAQVAILDVTGVRGVSEESVDGLLRAVRAARLVGATVLMTGVRPEVARLLVELGDRPLDVPTFGTLQGGIVRAIDHLRRRSSAQRRARVAPPSSAR